MQHGDRHHRPEEKPAQGPPAAASDRADIHRRSQNQFQPAVVAGFGKKLARHRGEPDAIDENHRRAEVLMKLVSGGVMTGAVGQPENVDGHDADQRPENPVRPAMTAGEGVDRIDFETVFERSLPAFGAAKSQQPEQWSASLLPPDAANDHHGRRHEQPAERVNDDERGPEQSGVCARRRIGRKQSRIDRAGERGQGKTGNVASEKAFEDQHRQPRHQTADGQHEYQRPKNRLGMVATHCGHQDSAGQREKHRIHHRQRRASVFRRRDAAEKQWNRQRRQDRQQSVKSSHRRGDPFAEHHVDAPKIGQKQQAQCPIPFLRADAVGRNKRPDQQAIGECHD